jgi:diguanylate cyclase (GGDEF)-like protein/PAS domain S-box-containing protein
MNLNLEKKLLFLFVLGIVSLTGIIYFLYSDATLRYALNGNSPPDADANAAIGTLRASLKDLETAEFRYTVFGDQNALTVYEGSAAVLHQSVKDLKFFFAGEQDRQRKLASLEPLVEKRLRYTEEVIAARKKKGGKAAEDLLRTGEGQRISGQIQSGLVGLEQAGLRASVHYNKSLNRSFKIAIFLVTAGFALALAILLMAIAMIWQRSVRRRQTRQTLRELRQQFRLITEGLRDCSFFMLRPDGRIAKWNSAAERLFGFRRKEIEGSHFSTLFPEEEIRLGKSEHCLLQAAADGSIEDVGLRMRKDGSLFHAHTVITQVRDNADVPRGFSVIIRDISEMKRNEESLKKLSLTVEQSPDLVLITDRNGKVEFVNKAAEDVTGFTRKDFLAGGLDVLRIREKSPDLFQTLWSTVLAGQSFQAEVTGLDKSGEPVYLDAIATPIMDGQGPVTHVVFTSSDVTPIRLMSNRLDFLASYDSLTGLPNRDLFTGRLDRDVAGSESGKGVIAVLTLDIDRFKYINEIYSLDAGNKVLKQVADSLSVSVSKGDTVGRLGSDEFGIVLHDIKRPSDVILFVKMIMKNVPQIIMSGGEEIPVTLAAGIAMYPADGRDARTLIKNADTALSKAKGLGRNHYQFYTTDMNVGISELVFMERRLTEALQNKEYVLTFQPYYHLSTRKVAGSEALLKWNNDEFGQVSPTKFIPMLEETGMIIDVGKWVLQTACMQIREWSNRRGSLPMSVNLSPFQFRHEYLVETVENTIHEYGIDAGRLTLEVTESTFMKDQDFAVSVLKRLKGLGVRIAIDDFGTGYSSLSYLKKFPVDFVKIDQSFIKDVATDPDTMSLVTAIVSMSHSLSLKTIAEGVETEEQWKILRLLKCDMAQGYYFSRPVSARDFENLLA